MLFVFTLVASCSKEVHVKGTNWKGVGTDKNIELVLNDIDGYVIKHYFDMDRDSFYVSYKIVGDSIIITRNDEMGFVKESFILISDTLKSSNMIFVKQMQQ